MKIKTQHSESDNDHDKAMFENFAKSIETEINQLVYEIYEITDEEQETIETALG